MTAQDLQTNPNYLAFDQWTVETAENGDRVAALTRVEVIVTDEWQEELCEADLCDEAELAELELQYLQDQFLRSRNLYNAAKLSLNRGFEVEKLYDQTINNLKKWWEAAIPIENAPANEPEAVK